MLIQRLRFFFGIARHTADKTSLPMLFFFALMVFFSFTANAYATGARQKLPNPGFRSYGVWDPKTTLRMDIAVWYPTARAPRDLHLEGWSMRVSRNAPPFQNSYPVILLSHDTVSSRLGSHDLATYLARHGFIVIAPTHPKDNALDATGILRTVTFAERPQHLLLAAQTVKSSEPIGPVMDMSRVGLLGVGAGAATVLQVAGASPDMGRLGEYCSKQDIRNPICSNWAKLFHFQMQKDHEALLAQNGPAFFTPQLLPGLPPVPSTPESPTDTPETLNSPENPEPEKLEMPSFKALAFINPGYVGLFSDAALSGISLPSAIIASENDVIYASPKCAERLRSLLSDPVSVLVFTQATHADLAAPCPPMHLDTFPALCGTETPLALDIRMKRNDFIVNFFSTHLGSPFPKP